ncbi:MAG: hypothetical protein K0U39_01315 [Alphaproteobacteria bacterium]|nr:hypothetical protein [Alphaproteobacteria bacterium]
MPRFIPRRAKFGDVYLHVTNIRNNFSTETETQTDQDSKEVITTRYEAENFTIDAFLQGPRAATDLENLKKMVNGIGSKLSLPGLRNGDNYLLTALNIDYPHIYQHFYNVSLTVKKKYEKLEKVENSRLSFLRQINQLANNINNALTDLNAVMDDFYQTVQHEIALSPIYSLQQISDNLNTSLSITQNFGELFENDVVGGIDNLRANRDVLNQRLKNMVKPKADSPATLMASAGEQLAEPNDEAQQERASSEQETKLSGKLQDYTTGIFAHQLITLTLDGKLQGDIADKEELRAMLTRLLTHLSKKFAQHDDSPQSRKASMIFEELNNSVNLFLRTSNLGDYRTITLLESIPLILFAWQHYGTNYKAAAQQITALNNFSQAGVMVAQQELLIPNENYIGENYIAAAS